MKKDIRKMRLAALAAALLLACSGCSGQTAKETEAPAESGTAAEDTGEETSEGTDETEEMPEAESGGKTQEESAEEARAEEKLTELSVPHMTPEEYPGVNGSTATLPLSCELYHLVTGVSLEDAERTIQHSKTTQAYYALMNGYSVDYGDKPTGLVIAYEPPEAVYEAMEEPGCELEMKAIGKDALVFMANEGNPVESLTEQQIKDIYSGKVRNWSGVRGRDQEIRAFQRPENSGSQNLMEKLVMQGTPMGPAPVYYVEAEMEGLLEKVASYNNEESALGYSVYYYARNMKDVPGLRFMAVNGVMPDNDTIRDGSYPYVNEFYAAIRKDAPADSPERKLFDWLTTEDGQRLIGMLGYVPVSDVKEEAIPGAGKALEEFVPSGSISLEDNERIILDGDRFFGKPGVFLYDGEFRETDRLEDVNYSDGIGIIDVTKPVVLHTKDESRDGVYAGLYIPEKREWVLAPDCYYLGEQEDGSFSGYRWDEAKEEDVEIVWKDGETVSEVSTGGSEFNVGENVWKESSDRIDIFRQDGALLKTISSRDYSMSGGYSQENHYIMYLQSDAQVVFDADGREVFRPEDMGRAAVAEGGAVWIQQVDPEGHYIWAHRDDGTEFLWDMDHKKDLVGGDGYVSADYRDEKSGDLHEVYYIYRKDGTTELYSEGEGPLVSSTGTPYSFHPGGGYFGWVDSRGIMLENREKGTMYNVKSGSVGKSDNGSISTIADDTFFLYGDVNSLWQKDKVLMTGTNLWVYYDTGYVAVLDDRDNKREYILREDGSVRYKGKNLPEYLTYVDERMIAGWDGTYYRVMDKDGKEVLRILERDVQSDL